MNILVLNPGGNSLKTDFVRCSPGQQHAFEGQAEMTLRIEDIGKNAKLTILHVKSQTTHAAPVAAESYEEAAAQALKWWTDHAEEHSLPKQSEVDAIGIRVVHGAHEFTKPALVDSLVISRIIAFESLAPLHNKSSIEILKPIRSCFSTVPIYAVFDTAFHNTIPEHAFTYAIPPELAHKHKIRRYGFHGISHRYLLERFAYLAGKFPEDCNVITTHLESGCSITAIEHGRSIDNTMGLTPLEGLMMGTRSGDIDPSIIALLMREEQMTIDEIMTLLNKKSGLVGVSGISLDTRVLMQKYDSEARAKLAMDVFAYRARKAVGSYAAVLSRVDALIFGGGIAENGSFVRKQICEGLRGYGVAIDEQANRNLIDVEGKLSTEDSSVQVWVIPTQEALEIAHECYLESGLAWNK